MMTWKDFKAIAGIIQNSRDIYAGDKFLIKDVLISDMADYLTATNPNFDRERFIAACK